LSCHPRYYLSDKADTMGLRSMVFLENAAIAKCVQSAELGSKTTPRQK